MPRFLIFIQIFENNKIPFFVVPDYPDIFQALVLTGNVMFLNISIQVNASQNQRHP